MSQAALIYYPQNSTASVRFYQSPCVPSRLPITILPQQLKPVQQNTKDKS